MSESIDITEIVDQWPESRWQVAVERAEREFGGCVADYDSDEFVMEVKQQIAKMFLDESFPRLVEEGYLKVTGVNDEGEYEYEPTEKGEQCGREHGFIP